MSLYGRIRVTLIDLFELSRQYCITICSFLVPINLLLTCCTLFCLVRQFNHTIIRYSASVAMVFGLAMIAHVGSWLAVGVVMAPTYILLVLGATCLGINYYASFAPDKLRNLLVLAISHIMGGTTSSNFPR